IAGSHKTENLGVERIIVNIVANPCVRAIIICGRESFGHYAGQALLSIWKSGVDNEGKIIGAKGPIPYIENIDAQVVERFREQVLYLEDMIGTEDPKAVQARIHEILKRSMPPFDKPALNVEGIAKKKSTKITQTSSEKLIVTQGIEIDPLSFKIACRL
ncbi:MAG: hypothetical protein U9Q92_02575, partial [archaeon]|nr:hypothetical protein [archaeon]